MLGIRRALPATGVAAVVSLVGLGTLQAWGEPQAARIPAAPATSSAPSLRLTLDEARQRVLANSKLLHLAALNVQSKGHATGAARADFFPKIIGNTVYLHFTDPLGTVVSTKSRPVLGIPAKSVAVNVLNQDSSFTNAVVLQPITDLLKVREGVRIARADERIAQAQLEKGARELLAGVEQLYWGLLAAHRIRAGVLEGLRGAEEVASLGTVEARTALLEAKQGLQEVDVQVEDLREQLDILLDLPPCTGLELIEPPLPVLPVACAEDAVARALAASPDLHEAAHNIAKAEAATRAARLDYVPSLAAIGGYTNQTGASYIQQDFGYVGVVGSYTFVDWGKRKNVLREREHLIAMANLKYRQTQDEIRQKALKAFRGLAESQSALILARELVGLRKEAEAEAKVRAAAGADLAPLLAAAKAGANAEVDAIKADLAYRQAHVELLKLIGP